MVTNQIVWLNSHGLSEDAYRTMVYNTKSFVIDNKLDCLEIVDDECNWIHEGYRFKNQEELNFFLLMFGNHYSVD
jgi:hypothetical protein